MGVDVSAETVIRRPREQVAAFAMDARNDPRWIGGIEQAEILDAEEVSAGVRVSRVAHFLGRRIEYVNEVVDHSPPARLGMRSVKAPFPMEVDYAFDEHPDGTRVTIRVRGDASGFYGVLSPVLGPMVRRSITRDLRSLKRLLESGQ